MNGNITYEGADVPIYSMQVPEGAGYPRIVIASQDNTDWSCLTRYGNEHNFTVEIVHRDLLSAKPLDIIANQLKPILFSNLDLSPDFAVANGPMLGGELEFTLPTEDGGNVLIRQITVTYYIQEINTI